MDQEVILAVTSHAGQWLPLAAGCFQVGSFAAASAE
jgi:hypothetical protein